jgi:NitT/TauT family transport system permease protein
MANPTSIHETNPSRKTIKSVLSVCIIAIVWETAAKLHWIDATILPAPSSIVYSWWILLVSGVLVPATIASVYRIVLGFTLGVIAALLTAFIMYQYEFMRLAIKPVIEFVRPISPIAWTPLAITWLGFGNPPAIFIVFIAAVFPIVLNTLFGLQQVSQTQRDVARSLGANRWLTFRGVVWPAAKPSVVTGLRLGLGMAWMSLIAAEMIGVPSGLGYEIQAQRQALGAIADILALMASIGVIGISMNYLIELYARRTMPWLQ